MSRPNRSVDDTTAWHFPPDGASARQPCRRRNRTAPALSQNGIPSAMTPQSSMASSGSSNSAAYTSNLYQLDDAFFDLPPSPSLSLRDNWTPPNRSTNHAHSTSPHPTDDDDEFSFDDDTLLPGRYPSPSRPSSASFSSTPVRPSMHRAQSAIPASDDDMPDISSIRRNIQVRRIAEIRERMNQFLQARDELGEDGSEIAQFIADLQNNPADIEAVLAQPSSVGGRRQASSQDRAQDRFNFRNRPGQFGTFRQLRRGDGAYLHDDIDLPPAEALSTSTDATQVPEDSRHPATFLYSIQPAPTGSDVWPDVRDYAKVPAKLVPIKTPTSAATKKASGRASTSNHRQAPDSADHVSDLPFENIQPTWPKGELPSEIYYLITDHLSRDDVKAMRLTCQEFEHHISCILFRTVVVPFNTEIYGMLQGTGASKIDVKGKGKIKSNEVGFWKNSKAEDIYTGYGIDVFRSFGARMKKFGMSFEVDEEALANPPLKSVREAHKSYWGEYQWPYPEYQRFEQVAGLEDAADETPRMKNAFSLLGEVQELALSLDSGLGWVCGPDQSLRSRILRRQNAVFGTKHDVPERKIQAQRDLWHHLKACCTGEVSCDLRHSAFFHRQMSHTPEDHAALGRRFVRGAATLEMPYVDLQPLIDPTITDSSAHSTITTSQAPDTPVDAEWRGITEDMLVNSEAFVQARPSEFLGGMMVVKEDTSDHERFEAYPIIPNQLSKLQKEWLLETEWAQRAFLSSYLVAIVDSRMIFHNVHTLNFARISSRFLHSLGRNDFWNALPNIRTVNLQVIADWRDVIKDNAGFVETPRVSLQTATFSFQKLITDMIAPRRCIKSLKIGWACGGEHARGLHARNKHLMPAPFLPQEWLASVESMTNTQLLEQRMIEFRHIEELTLKNCWMPPNALISFVKKHEGLVKLTLDSVSLTAPLVINAGLVQQGQNFAAQMGMPLPPMPVVFGGLNPAQGVAGQPVQQVNMAAMHNANVMNLGHQNFMQAVAAPVIPPAGPTNWFGAHRAGSWPYVLDIISPGVTLAAHGSTTSPVNIISTNKAAKLTQLTLNSCGYACLHNPRFDESAIQQPTFGGGSVWFSKRFQALTKVMLSTKCAFTAEIVQFLPPVEVEALVMGWDCRTGWPAGMEEEEDAEGAVFDGCLAGGTGRYSGVISSESRVVINEDN